MVGILVGLYIEFCVVFFFVGFGKFEANLINQLPGPEQDLVAAARVNKEIKDDILKVMPIYFPPFAFLSISTSLFLTKKILNRFFSKED